MPTIVTHVAVPLALGLGLGKNIIPPRLLITGMAFAIVPDLDVLSFKLGIRYADGFGHRGFSHSLLFAALLPTIALLFRRWFQVGYTRIWLFLSTSLLSHSLLDALTNGGLGVGWLWPWSDQRFFFPTQVIKVAPFRLSAYLEPRGIAVMISELYWVWLPALVLTLLLWFFRLLLKRKPREQHG